MKEEIKELRVKIDGLAQLVKHLTAAPSVLNVSSLPEGVDIDTVIKNWEKYKIVLGFIEPDYSYVERINSTELNKVYDSLILAKAWLGKILGELGESTPYANDGQRKTVQDIEPTADSVRILEVEKDYIADKKWSEMNHIEKVDWLREEIKNIENIKKFDEILPSKARTYFIWGYKHLAEARFWLGFELQRIRENGTT